MTFMQLFELCWYLEGYLELGGSLGVPRGLVCGSLDFHRHGEDWSVHWAGLGQQAVLKARVDLVQTHQSIHGMVWIGHPPVQHLNRRDARVSNETERPHDSTSRK